MDFLPQSSTAPQTEQTNDENTMVSWLEQRKKEREDEIKRLQQDSDVQSSARSIDSLIRARLGETVEQPEQEASREGPYVVEIRALFETRPVTSVLQSLNFRRTLENVVLAAGGSARAIRTFSSGVSSPSSRNTRSSSTAATPASASTLSIPTELPAPSSTRLSPSSSTINVTTAISRNDSGREMSTVDYTATITGPLPTTQNQTSAIPSTPIPATNASHFTRNAARHAQTENLFMRHRHQEMVMEISELLHQELVSRSLRSDFREQLEAITMDHLGRTGTSGQDALAALSNLPPTGHLRFPRVQEGGGDFFWEQDAMSNEDSDNISLLSARITTNGGMTSADRAAMQRQQGEMSKMKNEMKKMKQMMQLVFDMQIDLQRTMKQEMASALSRDATQTEVPRMQVQKSGPVRVGQCLICLDGKAEILVYRCGHLCLCHKCSLTLPHHQTTVTCPVCRAPVEDFVRVYNLGSGSNNN